MSPTRTIRTCPRATRSSCAARSARRDALEMRFDPTDGRSTTCARHQDAPGAGRPLPFRIVDEEIYRSLPDRRARHPRQGGEHLDAGRDARLLRAARRAVPGPEPRVTPTRPAARHPAAACSPAARRRRSARPRIPRCTRRLSACRTSYTCSATASGPSTPHYEALLDDLQTHYGSAPKIIASSATLAGHDEQVAALYRRDGRTFPRPGPRVGRSFWSRDTDVLARRFAGARSSRGDAGVRDRPADRVAPAGHPARRR